MAKRSIQREGFSHQYIGIEFKGETHEVLHVEHSWVFWKCVIPLCVWELERVFSQTQLCQL